MFMFGNYKTLIKNLFNKKENYYEFNIDFL